MKHYHDRELLNFRSEAGMTEAIAKYMRARGLTNQAEALRQIVARGLEAAQ